MGKSTLNVCADSGLFVNGARVSTSRDLSNLSSAVLEIQTSMSSWTSTFENMSQRVDAVDSQSMSTEARVVNNSGVVSKLAKDVSELKQQMTTVIALLQTMSRAVSSVERNVTVVDDRVSNLETNVSSLSSAVHSLTSTATFATTFGMAVTDCDDRDSDNLCSLVDSCPLDANNDIDSDLVCAPQALTSVRMTAKATSISIDASSTDASLSPFASPAAARSTSVTAVPITSRAVTRGPKATSQAAALLNSTSKGSTVVFGSRATTVGPSSAGTRDDGVLPTASTPRAESKMPSTTKLAVAETTGVSVPTTKLAVAETTGVSVPSSAAVTTFAQIPTLTPAVTKTSLMTKLPFAETTGVPVLSSNAVTTLAQIPTLTSAATTPPLTTKLQVVETTAVSVPISSAATTSVGVSNLASTATGTPLTTKLMVAETTGVSVPSSAAVTTFAQIPTLTPAVTKTSLMTKLPFAETTGVPVLSSNAVTTSAGITTLMSAVTRTQLTTKVLAADTTDVSVRSTAAVATSSEGSGHSAVPRTVTTTIKSPTKYPKDASPTPEKVIFTPKPTVTTTQLDWTASANSASPRSTFANSATAKAITAVTGSTTTEDSASNGAAPDPNKSMDVGLVAGAVVASVVSLAVVIVAGVIAAKRVSKRSLPTRSVQPVQRSQMGGRSGNSSLELEMTYRYASENSQDHDELLEACRTGDEQTVSDLLKAGSTCGGTSQHDTTPLIVACGNNARGIVELLVRYKASVNSTDAFGRTALLVACRAGHTRLAKALLQANAEISVADADGFTPLHAACTSAQNRGKTARMLLRRSADINAVTVADGLTPLMTACRAGREHAVQALLSARASVNTVGFDRHTTAMLDALALQHYGIVRHLAASKADLSVRSVSGRTLVEVAAVRRNSQNPHDVDAISIEKFLVVASDFNAVHWACEQRNGVELRRLLRSDAVSYAEISHAAAGKLTPLQICEGSKVHKTISPRCPPVVPKHGHLLRLALGPWSPAAQCVFPAKFRWMAFELVCIGAALQKQYALQCSPSTLSLSRSSSLAAPPREFWLEVLSFCARDDWCPHAAQSTTIVIL